MGLFDRLGLTRKRFDDLSSPLDLGIKSPWAEGDLPQIILSELLGEEVADQLPMSRSAAIGIPSVSKARNLLVSVVGGFPLTALDTADDVKTDDHAWLYRTNGPVGPRERMAWTIDDGIFHGTSLWATERGAADAGGRKPILNAEWVPQKEWKITEGHVLINDHDVADDEFILFNFPFEGLLNIANRTLRGARDTELAWTARMRNPIFLTELRVTDDTNLEQGDLDAWADAYEARHRAGKPSFGISPAGTQIVSHGGENGDASMYLESRNAIRTDVGSFLNIRASMLDGTTGVESLTYTTTEGERNSFYEFDLPFWTNPIEERLSMDDVVPRGTRVRFDKYEQYAPKPNPTGAPTKD